MKIRSINELIDKINGDLAWRKKELTQLLSNVNIAKEKSESTAIRSAVVLLYAHWEGFTKNSAEYYLSYISSLKLTFQELNVCFVALSLKYRLNDFEGTNKSSRHEQLINYLFYNMADRANIPTNIVDTQSNLNSVMLREILIMIGINYEPYSTKANLIDEKLLKNRNNIAHGQVLLIDKAEYLSLHTEVTQMIFSLSNDIQNAAVMKLYKRQPTSQENFLK